MFARTTFRGDLVDQTEVDGPMYDITELLCTYNQTFYTFFQLLSLMLNLCLCIDLILTIYNPFQPSAKRLKWYVGSSIVGVIFIILFIRILELSDNVSYSCFDLSPPGQFSSQQEKASLVLAMVLSIYIVVAIYSTVYSYRRLHRPGVSRKVRSLFLRKNFLYVVVFILLWMIQQSNNYYSLFNPQTLTAEDGTTTFAFRSSMRALGNYLGIRKTTEGEDESQDQNPVQVISAVSTFSTGIFLTLVRLYEPHFRFLVMEKLYAVMGELYEPQMSDGMTIEEFKLQNQAMNSILASSLNVELVYVILTSVTSFSKVELANDDFDTNRLAGLVITNGINQDPI
jgi:hypothetical protein